MQRARVSTHF